MSHIIRLRVGELEYEAQLNESETAQAIYDALPIECIGSRWGDEYYSRIDVQMTEADDARSEMAVGELAYWPPGTAFCIFFGPTPASFGDEPRAASSVNPIGHISEDCSELNELDHNEPIVIEAM
ncbi:MAG: cyclophilin-like fold protein [Planctomycetota bacterium]|nr:cyclophilin-like fold protein [Planctomycetota bacterium]